MVVIGGSSGMGKAVAKRAVAAGMVVTITGRGDDTLQEAARALGVADAQPIDIASEASIREFFQRQGPVDHVVTSAAFVRPGPFKTGSTEDARTTFEGKFWSQYLVAKHAEIRRSMVFFSGVYSRRPAPGVSAVVAVNAAIEGLARALAVELAPVRFNVISPGLIQGTAAYNFMSEEQRQQMFDATAKALPAGIVGDADSVAGLTLGLLESPYVTGTVVDIDGGGLLA
ncbi:MAG: SDR family oxidoreductase [Candidatus Competibacterales bacterium]